MRTGTSGALAAMYTRHLETVADSMEPEELSKQQVSPVTLWYSNSSRIGIHLR